MPKAEVKTAKAEVKTAKKGMINITFARAGYSPNSELYWGVIERKADDGFIESAFLKSPDIEMEAGLELEISDKRYKGLQWK